MAGSLISDKNAFEKIRDAVRKRRKDKPLESLLRNMFPRIYGKNPRDEEIDALKKKIVTLFQS